MTLWPFGNFVIFSENPNLQNVITKLDAQTVAQFDDHDSIVWRVSWNITGTILASSGDDGCVRMFKSKFLFEPSSLTYRHAEVCDVFLIV